MISRRSALTSIFIAGVVLTAGSHEANGQTPSPFAGVTVSHVGVVMRDINTAVKDYAEFLGEPAPKVGQVKSLQYPETYKGDHSSWAKIAMIGMGNVLLDLVEPVGGVNPWSSHMARAGEGLQHIAIEVDDVDAAMAELLKRGAQHEMGLKGSASQYANMVDTLGITFEVMKRGAMKAGGYDPATLPAPTKFATGSHVEQVSVVVRDANRSAKMLAEIIGVAAPKATSHSGATVVRLDTKPIAVEFISPRGGKSPWRERLENAGPSIYSLGVRVKNIQESLAYARKSGGVVVVAPARGRAVVDLKGHPFPFAFELIEQ